MTFTHVDKAFRVRELELKNRVARMVAGRYRTLDDADLAIRDGRCRSRRDDRATIADPDLVAKSLAG